MEKVRIAYFSGTGGTARAADAFETELKSRGLRVDKQEIKRDKAIPNGDEELLVLLFAVHAANAPLPVYLWLNAMTPVAHIPAVVISVSGGGEISPNTACRLSSIKRLEKKGYDVVYEHSIVMPSNMSIATPGGMAARLLAILPDKVRRIADDVLSGMQRRTRPKAGDRVLSVLLEVEKKGAALFGKGLYADAACTGCGWCEKKCPGANIRMDGDKPVFDGKCVLCFGCVYGCPAHAVKARYMRFMLNKDGFDIRRFETGTESGEEKTGAAWKGVQRYLDEDDM